MKPIAEYRERTASQVRMVSTTVGLSNLIAAVTSVLRELYLILLISGHKMKQRVKVYHWRPGRWDDEYCPIPSYFVKQAQKIGSRYLTVAVVLESDEPVSVDTAFCCPRDVPSREMGRRIALARAQKGITPGLRRFSHG